MLMPTSTAAIVGIGNTSTNTNSIAPKSNFFILQPHPSFQVLQENNYSVVIMLFTAIANGLPRAEGKPEVLIDALITWG